MSATIDDLPLQDAVASGHVTYVYKSSAENDGALGASAADGEAPEPYVQSNSPERVVQSATLTPAATSLPC